MLTGTSKTMLSKLKFTKSAIYNVKYNCKINNNVD